MSESGTLAYRPARNALNAQLLWSDHRGLTTPLPIEPDVFRRPSLSPDGRRLAIDTHRGAAEEHDVWVYNLYGNKPAIGRHRQRRRIAAGESSKILAGADRESSHARRRWARRASLSVSSISSGRPTIRLTSSIPRKFTAG